MTVKTVQIDDTTDVPIPKHIVQLTESEMTRHGYEVSILEQCQVPDHSSLVSDTGRTPRFMTDGSDVSEVIRSGVAFPFHVEKEIAGYFGESTGSSNVTTFFVRDDMSIPEVIEKFHVTGQIEMAAEKVSPFCQDDVEPINVVAYAIATYAKGWLAEMILTNHDRFSKGSVSQDKGGLDVFDKEHDDWRQVKCVTKADNDSHLYYQWDMRGGLHFGDDHKAVNKSAGEVSGRVIPYTGEITPTNTLRCHSSYTDDDGQTYRYIWW